MFKITKAMVMMLFFILALCSLSLAQEESITITTYYPSPYGSYNELRSYSNTYLATDSGNVGIGMTAPGAKLEVNGQVKITGGSPGAGKVLTSDDDGLATWETGGVPAGVIVIWSGTLASIPSGWALCDGTNGTPDLRDRFIYGASSDVDRGETGGSATQSLGHLEVRFGPDTGDCSDVTAGHRASYTSDRGLMIARSSTAVWLHAAGSTPRNTNNQYLQTMDTAYSVLPPYFKLAYIMKL